MFGGISADFVKKTSSCIRYLIHIDDDDKHLYNISDITSNFDLSKYFKNNTDETEILSILYDDIKVYKSLDHTFNLALRIGEIGIYRKYYIILKDLYFSYLERR